MADSKEGVSRRDFLKTSGIAAGTLIGGGLIGGAVGYNVNKNKGSTEQPNKATDAANATNRGLMFFQNRHEFDVLSQAVERIFPEDELGAGAIGLGVPYFIDNQLAGNYGSNSREYMQGPFFEGEPTQGYQTHMTRADTFRVGIHLMDKEANKRFDMDFDELEGNQMDEILTDMQKDDVKMKGAAASFFFNMLRGATLDGAYADPIYNGNVNMEGWKMKDYPGNQMSYIDEIEKKFQKMEPKSLSSMEH